LFITGIQEESPLKNLKNRIFLGDTDFISGLTKFFKQKKRDQGNPQD